MPCKQCAKNRQRAFEKRKALMDARHQRLTDACSAGDQGSCMELQRLMDADHYRQANRYRAELHMKRVS